VTASADFDIAVLGSGPIGSLTAYNLTKTSGLKTVLVSREPEVDYTATYLNAGGSIRTYWDDPEKLAATTETTAFIRDAIAAGADLDIVDNGYLFLNRGVKVPAINISGAKLLRHVLSLATDAGLERIHGVAIESVEPDGDTIRIVASGETIRAKKAVLCLGVANERFALDLDIDVEKRQLYVLDVPVDDDRAGFPHTIFPLGHGLALLFVKKVAGKLRLVLGEEGLVEHEHSPVPEDHFRELVALGLADRMPFLRGAGVERILWGFDATNKLPRIESDDGRVFTANCGSAVRASAYIGRRVAEAVIAS
jgi:glycine/D-amino acid oxidase-like deaminating enzyme